MHVKPLENIGFAGLVLWECLIMYGRLLLGRGRLDLKVLANEIRTVGLSPLPIVTLVAVAVGIIVGIQAGKVLEQINLPELLLGSVGVSVVREFAPLLVGIFVAGRSGVALAVRIGSMATNREIDGLIVCGVNPLHYTVGPALLAMLLMSFALSVWTAVTVLGVTGVYLWYETGIPLVVFRDSVTSTIGAADLVQGVVKPVTFALLVTLIAAVNGGQARRDSGGISRAATQTMVWAIVAIVLTDLLFVYSTQ